MEGLKGEREGDQEEEEQGKRKGGAHRKMGGGGGGELVFDSVGVRVHKEITQKFCTNGRSRM